MTVPHQPRAPGSARTDGRYRPVASAGALTGLAADAIVFGGGLPDPATHPTGALARHLGEVLAEEPGPALTYQPGLGVASLRRSVAAYLSRRDGVACHEDQICITHGSSGAISLAAMALLDPGDVVVVEEITYPGALQALGQAGVVTVACPVDGSGLVPEELARTLKECQAADRPARAVYFGANFGIPVGGWLPADRRDALAGLADEYDLFLLQDDTYGAIRFLPALPPSMVTWSPGRGVELGSFSKTIAPGIRLGWAAAAAPLAAALAATRTDLGASPLLQLAVARYMDSGEFDAHLVEVGVHYRAKRDALAGALAATCAGEASWTVPDGGFCIWMTLHEGGADHLAEVARGHGVAFLPQSYFSAGSHDGPRLRLAYGERPIPELVEGAHRLGRALGDR